jgi:hypothetical protein
MNRNQKISALREALSGNPRVLQELQKSQRTRSYDEMSDEELLAIRDKYLRRMTPQERAQYPDWYFTRDFDSLTDEQLRWMKNRAEGHEQAPPQ